MPESRVQPAGPKGRPTGRGYTLVEVLVVVAIIGMTSAVVVPQMLQPGSLTIQAAARRMISDVLYAQNEAIGRLATHKVVFDVTNNSYRVTDENDQTVSAPWGQGDYVVDFATNSQFLGVALLAVDFEGDARVSFDDLGTPSAGGTIDLAADGHEYRITVRAFTGRITVAPIEEGE
ncbi:MAG: GspH/FimT family protein [Phycisphaerae bacterium]|nr:GspH/FimT family protein [Phycisphaerae bacterium]